MLFKIKPKLIGIYTILYLVMATLVGGLDTWVLSQLFVSRLQERINTGLVGGYETVSAQVLQSESRALSTERAIARTAGVAEAVAEQDSASLNTLVRPLAANIPLVQILDSSGALVYKLHSAPEGSVPDEDASFTAWRLASRVLAGESDTLGDKFSGVIEGATAPSLYVAGPLILDNQRVGVVMVSYPLDTLVHQALSDSAAQVTIYRPNGQPAFSTFPKELRLPALTSETLAAVNVSDGSNILQNRTWALSAQDYNEAIGPLLVRGQPSGWALAVALPRTFTPASATLSPAQLAASFALTLLAVLALGPVIAKIMSTRVFNLEARGPGAGEDLDATVGEQPKD
jgi:hypothetical protein